VEFFGEPGCDLEAFTVAGAEGASPRVLRVAKGPVPVEHLRPEPLSRWAAALLASLPPSCADLRLHLEQALSAVGGAL
jgi:hypothetical protein